MPNENMISWKFDEKLKILQKVENLTKVEKSCKFANKNLNIEKSWKFEKKNWNFEEEKNWIFDEKLEIWRVEIFF